MSVTKTATDLPKNLEELERYTARMKERVATMSEELRTHAHAWSFMAECPEECGIDEETSFGCGEIRNQLTVAYMALEKLG